jgi:hypothetical protein
MECAIRSSEALRRMMRRREKVSHLHINPRLNFGFGLPACHFD